ncbi:MAG: alpha-hydroxy acid oxidase [Actinomycetota bacterium]|nr:alpha-hydroxy acid oxidase [Actinomycetota bacterium]
MTLPFDEKIRSTCSSELYDYLVGWRPDATPLGDPNEAAFLHYRLMPRILRGGGRPDLAVDVLGTASTLPLMVGPFSGDRLFHEDGLRAVVAGARTHGIPVIISNHTSIPLDELVGDGGDTWLQVGVHEPVDEATDGLDRAARAGIGTIVVTAVTPNHYSHRTHPARFNVIDAMNAKGLGTIRRIDPDRRPGSNEPWTWGELERFVAMAHERDLRVVLKGVLHPGDAEMAEDAGCDAVMVSNAGARQLKRIAPSPHQIAPVRAAWGDDRPLLAEGGIRHGSDIIVALALGADVGVVVRPVAAGLAAAGQEGVEEVLATLRDELLGAWSWLGLGALDEVGPHVLHTDAPMAPLGAGVPPGPPPGGGGG